MPQKRRRPVQVAYTYALLLAFVPRAVMAADDAPLMIKDEEPVVIRILDGRATVVLDGEEASVALPPGFFVNEAFAANVEARFVAQKMELAVAVAQRDHAVEEYKEMAAQPGLSLPAILAVAGVSLLLGAGIGAGVVLISK